MVDRGDATKTFEYKFFRGINKRDDENNLPIGQTPEAQNFELVNQTGLQKKLGFEEKFPFDYSYSFETAVNFHTINGQHYYLSVSYPEVYYHERTNGFPVRIDSTLVATGEPFFIPLPNGQIMLVDGANAPRLITSNASGTITSTAVTFAPAMYSATNSTVINQSPNALAANPSTLFVDMGYPRFGALYENRVWLAGDKYAPRRIYVSKAQDYSAFGNSGASWDVAFFVDVQCSSDITALKVINNQYLVIYCEREILVVTGKFPPASGFPTPHFEINELSHVGTGALSCRLVADKGDNDHFYLGSNGKLYTLQSSPNFQDIKPKGLSGKIFPFFEGLTNETLKRGILVNHQIKGELQLWIPSANNLRYPDQRLVLNYSESLDGEPEWSRDRKFGDFYLRDAFVDNETNELILLTPTKFLANDSGTSFDGTPIDMVYQLSTLDFGDPDINKEIVQVTIYASNNSASKTTAYLHHLWDTNNSASQAFVIPSTVTATFDNANYDTDVYAAEAGKLFKKIEFQIANPSGKILKSRIRHSQEADIFIHSIIFRVKFLGK